MRKIEIDNTRLAQAIGDYSKAVSTTKSHRQNRLNHESQIQEVDAELIRLQRLIKDLDFHDATGIADIKRFAQEKSKLQTELEMLGTARETLTKKLKVDTSYADALNEIDCKHGCWRVAYDGMRKAIDLEPLRELIAVGLAADVSLETTLSNLNLSALDSVQLDALAKQFNLPK